MELNFGEKIKRLRRSRDLTQEALADALGISAQSVSKWECAYGYPDITQLPAIANFFGVTIDELLNNDADGRTKALEYFGAHHREYAEASEEKIDFISDYYRRYPDEPYYAYVLCENLSVHITQVCPENRDKYYPLLRQTAEKLIDNAHYRDAVVMSMINACPEEELDEWLGFAAYSPRNTRRNRLIERYSTLGMNEQSRMAVCLSNLESIALQLDKRYPDSVGAEIKGEYHKAILDIIASFGKNGQIPDGWLGLYAYKELVYAACLFGMNKCNEGKTAFIHAVEKLHRYHNMTEEFLDTGSSLFGGLRVNKNWLFAMDETGAIHKLYGTAYLKMFNDSDIALSLLTNPRWAWFDSARNEDYYKEAVEWLKEIAEKSAD